MSRYSKEKKKEHLAITRRAMARKPDITLLQLMNFFEKQKQPIGINYASDLVRKVKNERATRYDRYTKSMIVADFEDFIRDLQPRLRELAEDRSGKVSVMAINALVQHKKELIEMAMDLGLIDRHLGKIEHYNVAEIAKLVEQANEKRRRHNNPSDTE